MNTNTTKIPVGEKISYLLANLGNIPLMTLLNSFFLLFYTTVVGLDPALLATVFLASKIMDGISDPLMGYLLDRFPVTKLGKFRPMLILGTVVCSINYILRWFGAAWSPVGKYAIVTVTYLLIGWTFDIMDISLNGLLPVMTADSKQKNQLTLIKTIGYVAGSLILAVIGPMIVSDGTLESYYILIFGSVAATVALSVLGALGVKERVAFVGSKEEKYSVSDLLKFFSRKPVWAALIASLIFLCATGISSSANTFFFTYVMGDLELMSSVTLFSVIGMIPGVLLSPILANKVDRKYLYLGGILIAMASFAIRLLNPTSLSLVYAGTLISGLGSGILSPQLFGIVADVTLYIQSTTGKRAEAAIASMSSFISKAAQGVAGAVPGYVLAAFGFVKDAAQQPASLNDGIIACVIVIPVVGCAIAAILFGLFYNLSKKDIEVMAETL